VAVLGGAFFVFTQLWTSKLWFDSVDFTSVFTTMLVAQCVLFASFFAVMTLIVGANMWLAYRARPADPQNNPAVERYREALERYAPWLILAPSAVFGVISGMNASAQTMTYLSWLNRVPFGQSDSYFGMDASFYVFELPVWRDLLSFGQSVVLLSGLAAAVVHFVVGNFQIGSPQVVRTEAGLGVSWGKSAGPRGVRTPAVRTQLSILGGLWLVAMGGHLLLDRYSLLTQEGTLFTGMHFTDWHSRSVALLVMAVIAFICALLFFANCFIKRIVVPVASVVLMVVSGLILQMIYPAVIQNFEVKPNEPDKERPFIQEHIQATRGAFGIDTVEIQPYSAVTTTSSGQLKNDAEALPGVRLIDPAVVSPTFTQLQQVRGYYGVQTELDVDRYVIDGKETDAVVAAREINLGGLPDQQWNNIHTVYTHGNGLIAAYGNRKLSGGSPDWIEKDLPSKGELGEYEGRIYFGEFSTQYVVVGREEGQEPIELDTPGGSESGSETYNVYAGSGGVPIGDFITRVIYAAYFTDINLLLSDRVNSQSKLLYDRTPQQRVQQVAPWLTLDSNIYPAVVDKRLVWIVDGYTKSDLYPNSQQFAFGEQESTLLKQPTVNYLRNSVKAIVDAADGSVTLYAWDESEPMLRTYMAAFPGTVKPRSEISSALLAHLRYPADLFGVQREVLSRYHMTDPGQWYQQSDLWQIPVDPRGGETSKVSEPAYYLSIKWPGTDAAVFSNTAVYVPKNRQNLAAYLSVVAEASSQDYGKLRVLTMSNTQQIDGPGQTFNAMTTDSAIADALRNYLMQGSAQPIYGNLLTLPIGGGLLYVMPFYAQRDNTGSYPALTYVMVRFGDKVAYGLTLQEALDKVFQGDAGADTGETPTDEPTTPDEPVDPDNPDTPAQPTGDAAEAAALMKEAQTAFTDADAALREGDLAAYQAKVNEAKEKLAQALEKLGVK
jgi:uncharacterized membrane protein (UPF0182 family)